MDLSFPHLFLGALGVDAELANPAFLRDDEISVMREFWLLDKGILQETRRLVFSCRIRECPAKATSKWAGSTLSEGEVLLVCVGSQLLTNVLLRVHWLVAHEHRSEHLRVDQLPSSARRRCLVIRG